jgi:hypothetical protein
MLYVRSAGRKPLKIYWLASFLRIRLTVSDHRLKFPALRGNALGTIQDQAGIAQLVERNLAKVEVASSSLVSRSNFLFFSVVYADLRIFVRKFSENIS